MPNILAFDTATDAISVALLISKNSSENIFFEHFEIAPQKHSELILPIIFELLAEAQITLKQLDAIAFGQGPGSFMGVRIAAGVAQGLAFGLNLPVIPISTLQTLAQTAYESFQIKEVVAGWDARMQEIYWGIYRIDQDNIMQLINEERLSPPAEIIFPDKKWCVVGNAWQVYHQQFSKTLLNQFSNMHADLYPQAKAMAKIALKKFQNGEVLAAKDAQPVYLRESVIEKKS